MKGEESMIIPTQMEAIKKIQESYKFYDPKDKWKNVMIKVINSFPEDWNVGLMVIRYRNHDGFGVEYCPVIETQTYYIFARYLLRDVVIYEVNYKNVYDGQLVNPASMATREPIAIWRTSKPWKEKQEKIWDVKYWEERGAKEDPELKDYYWIPLLN